MAIYTVHQPPVRDGEAASDPGRFVFVRDGFHFWAFVFGPLWIIRHRLWLVLLLYVVVMAVLSAGLWAARAGAAAPLVHFLVAILIGIEAGTLRRWTLTRRGWKTLGVVVGDDLESAERRFFDRWTVQEGTTAASTPPSSPTPKSTHSPQRFQSRSGIEVLGLFPEPGAPR